MDKHKLIYFSVIIITLFLVFIDYLPRFFELLFRILLYFILLSFLLVIWVIIWTYSKDNLFTQNLSEKKTKSINLNFLS
jgi:hypothetical protein